MRTNAIAAASCSPASTARNFWVEIEAQSPLELVRLAWHLGNRHTQVEIVGGKLRMCRDHVLENMVAGLGGKLTPIEAPFEPEAGAHGHAQGEHAHGDHHDHGE